MCQVQILGVHGILPTGAINPTHLKVTGRLTGLPPSVRNDVTVTSNITGPSMPTSALFGKLGDEFLVILPITTSNVVCGTTQVNVQATCSTNAACYDTKNGPLLCSDLADDPSSDYPTDQGAIRTVFVGGATVTNSEASVRPSASEAGMENPTGNSSITLTLSKGLIDATQASPICSGQQFQYTLTYNWSGGVPGPLVLVDNVPAVLDVVGATVGQSPSPSSPTILGNVVTFNLAGFTTSSGSITVSITVRFKPGVTCDGTQACNRATLQLKDDAASTVVSNEVCVTASAVNKWQLQKTVFSVGCGLLDGDVVFQIAIINPSGADVCGMDLMNVKLDDTLPNGAIITSVVTGNGTTFTGLTPTGGTYYNLPGVPTTLNVSAGWNWTVLYVHVTFPSGSFSAGQVVTNQATLWFNLPCDPQGRRSTVLPLTRLRSP